MKRLVSPLLLVLILSTLSLGWRRSTPPLPAGLYYPASMTLDGDRLLVSDVVSGLHIYDVSNLAAPTRVIQIPLDGNRGSAVKDDIIYTNDAGQLQAIRLAEDGYTVVARIGVKYHDPGPIDGGTESFSCFCSTTDYSPMAPEGGGGSSYATFAVIGNQLYRVDYTSLIVYDVAGRRVRTLVSETQSPGVDGFTATWDGRDDRGRAVATGVYFYRLVAGDYSQTRKMVLLK